VLLILAVVHQGQSQNRWTPGCSPNMEVFQAGEELTYEVSYLGIGLGTITSRIISVDSTREGIRISAEGLVRTYRGVPFVTLNTLFQTRIGDSLASVGFRNKEYIVEDSAFKHIEYVYKPRLDVVYINEYIENHDGTDKRDTLDLEGKKWQDGLSLLFYARAFAHAKCKRNVPVLMYRSKATTKIHFGTGKDNVGIDALKYDVRTVQLAGETGFTGIFGLTGGFEGWFSDDNASVPITAKMHVLIGSVRIELIKWKRRGWRPPRYDS
jgi:hypothetical protein